MTRKKSNPLLEATMFPPKMVSVLEAPKVSGGYLGHYGMPGVGVEYMYPADGITGRQAEEQAKAHIAAQLNQMLISEGAVRYISDMLNVPKDQARSALEVYNYLKEKDPTMDIRQHATVVGVTFTLLAVPIILMEKVVLPYAKSLVKSTGALFMVGTYGGKGIGSKEAGLTNYVLKVHWVKPE